MSLFLWSVSHLLCPKIYSLHSKYRCFKTTQYCSCAQAYVHIFLLQVDWRGLAPQTSNVLSLSLYSGRETVQNLISKSREDHRKSNVNQLLFSFLLNEAKNRKWTFHSAFFSTPVNNVYSTVNLPVNFLYK